MAERDFEEKAEELREARDIYREEEAEEAGAEAIGIVPGAPGRRPARGRRVEDEVREQQNLLRGLKAEVQELKSVVPELKKSLVETSEAFEDFHKNFKKMGEGLKDEFKKVTLGLRKEFEKLLDQVGVLAEEFGYVVKEFGVDVKKYSEGIRKSYRDLSEVLGRQRRRLESYDREYERTIRDIRARVRRRTLEGRAREAGGDVGRRRGREFRLPAPVMQEVPRRGIGGIFGRRFESLLGVGGGGYGRGRYRFGGGGIGEEAGTILFAAGLGPLGVHVREWLGRVYSRWQEARTGRREERERLRLGRRAGLLTGGFVPDVVGVGEELFGFRRRRVDKFTLRDVELVQERQAKIYAEKLYVETKGIEGVGAGGGGLLEGLLGRFGRFGRIGRWIGRRAGWIGLGLGAGLAFLSGVREEGVGRGLARAGGTLAGGLGGAKLGAIIGTAIAPGIGTAIGTALGGMAGMLGGERIADAIYSGMKKLIKDRDWVESLGKAFTGAVDKIGEFLKDIIEGVKAGVEAVGRGAERAVRGVGRAMEWVRENIGRLDLGAIARWFEATPAAAAELTKGAGVVSQTPGDIGGMSAGMYQFTKGAQLRFLRQYGFIREFEGVRFGTPEWKRRWQEVARRYGERFARAQQEFAIREYFAPGAAAAEEFGIDVRRSRALQEMVFARAVQHGVGGFEGVLRNVFKGMAPEQVRALSPEEVITRVYDHLIANVDKYWSKSAPRVRASVRERLIKEREMLLAIERQKREVQGQEKMQKQITTQAKNLYEGMSAMNQVISGRSILDELLKQEGVQKLITRAVKELHGGIKRQVEWYRLSGKEVAGFHSSAQELKESMQGVVRSSGEMSQSMSVNAEELERLAKEYEAKAADLETQADNAARVGFSSWMAAAVKGEATQEDLEKQEREVDELRRQARELRKKAQELRRQAEEQRRVQASQGGVIQEQREGVIGVEELKGTMQEALERGRWVSYPVEDVKVVDEGLLRDQQEVARRVIEEGVRREAEWLGGMVELIKGLKGKGGGTGGVGKIIMPGGEAFSKVPLFPEDLGLVMMMLGLV